MSLSDRPAIPRRIIGFRQDADGDWVAELECGHAQHVRHDPPWQQRPWVVQAATRTAHIGTTLPCVRCAAHDPVPEGTTMTDSFPVPGVELTHLLVVQDVDRARDFYRDVLGAAVHREYGGTSCVLRFQGAWLLLVTGGGPTPDKPDVTFAAPSKPTVVSHSLTLRVPDCHGAYETLRARGAAFLTPPVDRGGEIRAFFRDPDGHLLEISEITG